MTKGMRIAIDGPAGAGKSTVAKMVARRLGLHYVDTGAMYRVLTLEVLKRGLNPDDEKALLRVVREIKIDFSPNPEGPQKIYLNGEDVTEKIRSLEVTRNVSRVARIPGVREQLVAMQRQVAAFGEVVMEGRDIGTVVMPNATLKVFLTASLEERARRRQQDIKDSTGLDIACEELVKQLQIRDEIDSSREVGPLKPAQDAVVIDTSRLSVEQVVDRIADMVVRRNP